VNLNVSDIDAYMLDDSAPPSGLLPRALCIFALIEPFSRQSMLLPTQRRQRSGWLRF
jgi:hypothetical protein